MVYVILQHGHPDGQKNDRNLQTLLIVNNLQCTVESGRDSVFYDVLLVTCHKCWVVKMVAMTTHFCTDLCMFSEPSPLMADTTFA